MEIEKIIRLQFNEFPLDGFRLEVGARTADRFFAYIIVPVKEEAFSNLFDLYLKHRNHSSCHKPTEEELKKYKEEPPGDKAWSGENPFDDLTLTEQIAEGRFSHVAIIFTGCLFEEYWYVMEDIRYYENFSHTEVEDSVSEMVTTDALQHSPIFQAIPAVEITTDIAALNELMEANREMNGFIRQKPYTDIPEKKMPQYPNMRRFIGQPWMVAHLKQDAREKLNRQYENYMNETIFFPLVNALRVQRPGEFTMVHSLYDINYPLIYPNSKDHVMAVIKTTNGAEEDSRLHYFLYHPATKKIYEWTRPLVRPVPHFHVFFIQEDLAGLSDWGNDYDVHDPSVTMDDPHFWNEYVFKKEKEEYVFLKEVDVKNNRKDIYPGF